ncbi:hypothetical protein N6H13_00755 [Paenibacillus sp. CC-CFT742]|nr:hypothetical protein [Paenibacillus sp. CC-CFT742]WJH29368.1 hypothetical protein N6H13_00755 [Paenibacillus sp. CC-CFT742]
MNVKRKLAFIAKLTGFILMLGMLTACDQNGTDSDAMLDERSDSSDYQTVSIASPNDDGKLTYWAELNGNAASIKSSFNEVPFFRSGSEEPESTFNSSGLPPIRPKKRLMYCLRPENCQI